MSRFKVRLKLQGFELDIDGSREDIPAIGQQLGSQLANLIEPSLGIVEGDDSKPRNGKPTQASSQQVIDVVARKKQGRRKSSGSSQNSEQSEIALNWVHDSQKYGMPNQSWNTAKKSLWLIYVSSEELKRTQLTARQIAETFNKHFKQAGMIRVFNVTRDLGQLKVNPKSAPISEDTTKNPSEWFLTDIGRKQAQDLIAGEGS